MAKLVLAAAVAVVVGYAYAHRDWARFERLSRSGVQVEGQVTGKRGKDAVDYVYPTPVKAMTSTGTGGYGNPGFDELEVGDKVSVYYLPDDPSESCLGDPYQRVREQNFLLIRVLLPSFLIAAWALARELKRHGPMKPA